MKTVAVISILLSLAMAARADDKPAGLDRLDFMIGKWRGTSAGESGEGQVERECARALNRKFLECKTTVTYPPQKKNPKGEIHVERAIFSFDKKAKKLRLRQFHGEGFVNSYSEDSELTFVTTEIENIPEGWRARETIKPLEGDRTVEEFDLAAPGQDFKRYSTATLRRSE